MESQKETDCNACHGCAFKEGSAANREPNNSLRGMIAALGGVPFFCHESLDWKNQSGAFSNDGIPRLPGVRPRICNGWRAEVKRLAAAGRFSSGRLMLRSLARAALTALEEFLDSPKGKAKTQAHTRLTGLVEALTQRSKDIGRRSKRAAGSASI